MERWDIRPRAVLLVITLSFGVSWALTDPNELRLVGGRRTSEGRLEIYHSFTWGTICDDRWSDTDAIVACRQLGYTSVITALYSVSDGPGEGSGSIHLDDVECTGNEGRLSECASNSWGNHNCVHREDVAIRCGYDNSYVRPMPIRLSGGNSASGLLEVYLDGVWGTVCDDYWDDNDAEVACRQLGFTQVASYSPSHRAETPESIHVYFVSCEGHEDDLAQCVDFRQSDWGDRYCGHYEDVTLACEHPDVEYSLRLADGPNDFEGRLEVNWVGIWGTVCDDYWDDQDATVACRQLGMGSPVPLSNMAFIPYGSGAIHLDDVMCNGWETQLTDCGHLALGSHNCVHSEDVIMACGFDGIDPSFTTTASGSYIYYLVNGESHYEGRPEVIYQGISGGICDINWTIEDATVMCRQLGFGIAIRNVRRGTFGQNSNGLYWIHNVTCQGHERTLQECAIGTTDQLHYCGFPWRDVDVACTGPFLGSEMDILNADVRLEGGNNPSEGRLEILYDGVWSTVCSRGWDDVDAQVVCRQLGFSHVIDPHHYIDWLPWTSRPILLSNVRCQGDESTIMQCRHDGLHTHDCFHSEDVVIKCQAETENVGVRVFAGIAGISVSIAMIVYSIHRRTQLRRQRNLLVVPESNVQHVTASPIPSAMQPANSYPVQQYGPRQATQPPYEPTSTAIPAAVPPLGYPDPNPLPPSYLTATQASDGVNQLPVYLPSPVGAAGMSPIVNTAPVQNLPNPNQAPHHR